MCSAKLASPGAAMSNDMADTQTAVHLSEIGQIGLTVRDLARARDFYQNTLGMQFLFDAGTMAFFQCGTVRLMIGASDKPLSGEGAILYFRVADIRGVHSALKNRGVTFVEEPHLVAKMKSHDLWMSFLKDPDGNTLALMSEIAPPPPEEPGR
jgi:methylmalonyl-CoA/ethylmalonyl-CoA epimerase